MDVEVRHGMIMCKSSVTQCLKAEEQPCYYQWFRVIIPDNDV